MQFHAAGGNSLKRQYRVVDRSQTAIGHQCHRHISLQWIVDGEHLVGQWHHQAAGSFHQYGVVAFRQPSQGAVDSLEIYAASVDACREMRRCRIAEYLWRGSQIVVFRQGSACQTSVYLYILGASVASGLDKLHGGHPSALCGHLTGKPPGGITFAGVSVYARYENGFFMIVHCHDCC